MDRNKEIEAEERNNRRNALEEAQRWIAQYKDHNQTVHILRLNQEWLTLNTAMDIFGFTILFSTQRWIA